MSLIGDLGDLTKDEATAKAIIDYAVLKLSTMLDEKIDRLEKLTITNITNISERKS
jgi:hypothetical protein